MTKLINLALCLALFASCKESRAIKFDSIEADYSPSYESTESLNFKAVHEAAHYVVYEKAMQEEGLTPSSRSISIVTNGKLGGEFIADDYGNYKTRILTFLAGYATRVVFFGEKAEVVFAEIKANDRVDYRAALQERGNDEMLFDDFKAAIAWVAAYKGKIAGVANRLQKEKFIKL